jgi:hypothetical protein
MTEAIPPKVEEAPGLVMRVRKVGWVAYWQCRTDAVEAGFRPQTVPLWRGIEPSRIDRAYISDQCIRLQSAMLVHVRGGLPELHKFDGTVRSLAKCYQTDADSGYRKIRFQTRANYDSVIRRIVRDHGDARVADIRARALLRWYEGWTKGGHIAMAHALMGMLRTLSTFGATMLESPDCRELKVLLGDMKFAMPKGRNEVLTAEQAIAVRAMAHEMGYPEIALSQAIQFEGTLRQRDCVGEWVPMDEPGTSDVIYGDTKWLRGIRWTEIDDNLILRHVTSKRQKMVEIDLKLAPMVLEELGIERSAPRSKLPAIGPVVVNHVTGRPFLTHQFRRLWREIATAAGIPKDVRNMDSRAGAISEATDSGAQLEDVRHAAAHSDIKMTQKYSRGSADKTAKVMQLRAAHRNKSGT